MCINPADPFPINPIDVGETVRARGVNVTVLAVEEGTSIAAWLDDDSTAHVDPVAEIIEYPGAPLPPGLKREAYHFIDPRTNEGVALALHPVTRVVLGWFSIIVNPLDDLEDGVPNGWTT